MEASSHVRAGQGWRRRLRRRLVQVGPGWTALVVTLASLGASLVFNVIAMAAFGLEPEKWSAGLFVSLLVPLLVAPPISWLIAKLLQEADASRRTVEHLVRVDPLTGVFNRRHTMQAGELEVIRARRDRTPLCAIMLDLDNFKAINDVHGHGTGDVLLQRVAMACNDCIRPYDTLARWGGEEFVVVLPSTALREAKAIAERVRLAVAAMSVPLATSSLTATVSVGVAAWEDPALTFAALVDRADHAMYEAKRTGRNRVCTWRSTVAATIRVAE
jgi:diguanylate cyclase (GGDEF)-like protein